jgi:type 1 glutamine amidotransferase
MANSAAFHVLVAGSRDPYHSPMCVSARPWFEQVSQEHDFTVEFTDNPADLTDVALSRCHVFVQLQLAPFDIPHEGQQSIQRFIEGGGGWVGVHAAGLTGAQFSRPDRPHWDWFDAFMGGVNYSPHPAYQTGVMVVEDSSHPVMQGVSARVEMADEWYEFDANPRGRVQVLAVADESSYKPNRPMGDHPLVWVNESYRRAVYIGVGHDSTALANPDFGRILTNAVLWAASRDL